MAGAELAGRTRASGDGTEPAEWTAAGSWNVQDPGIVDYSDDMEESDDMEVRQEDGREESERDEMVEGHRNPLPLLPLTSGVVLPGMVLTIALESDEAKAAAEAAGSAGGRLVLVPFIDGRYARMGVVSEIAEIGELPGGSPAMVVRGEERGSLGVAVPGTGRALWVQVEPVEDTEPSPAAHELAREYRAVLENILLARGARRIAAQLREVTSPSQIADIAGYSPDLTLEQKVQVLETTDVEARLRLTLAWAKETLADLTFARAHQDRRRGGHGAHPTRVPSPPPVGGHSQGIGRAQRARRTMDRPTITGHGPNRPTFPRTSARPSCGSSTSSSAPASRAPSTGRSAPGSTRSSTCRGAWARRTTSTCGRPAGSSTTHHDGLDDVKDRILEHLAVRKRRPTRSRSNRRGLNGAILALVGPPGVGKTSLGESVARALGRDSSGSPSVASATRPRSAGTATYVGAQPGRLVRALGDAGTVNPVLIFDEVDKVGSDYRGDPSSALLEVLDPAQNHTFRDHYLEVELDLSRVIFIATANVVDTIPGALLDRMEVIRLDGYIEDEKVAIARQPPPRPPARADRSPPRRGLGHR